MLSDGAHTTIPSLAAEIASAQPPFKILLVVSEDWVFLWHCLPVARVARDAGIEVVVATRLTTHGDAIRAEGFRVRHLDVRRGGLSPLRDLRTIRALWRLCRDESPSLVHNVAMKPVLYGGLAARLAGVPRVVSWVIGLGFMATTRTARARVLRPLLLAALRQVLRGPGSVVVVQNPDDRAVIAGLGMTPDRIVMIRGNGVDLDRFAPAPEPDGPVRVALVARLIWEKGVGEFVAAARLVRRLRDDVVFTLVGEPDPGNPSAVPIEQLQAWRDEGLVEWRGFVDDVPSVWAASHVAVLPSFYGEGVPKSLIEAAACGRPIVTTDTPGCREIGRHGENALLVPARDATVLADAICRLADDADLRARLGAAGRRIAADEFSDRIVATQMLALWRSLLVRCVAAR